MDIEELCFKWIYTYISAGDINQISRNWLLFLKSNIIITVLQGRYCCSVADVKYYVELLKPYTVLEFLKLETVIELFPKSASVAQFLKLEIVIKFLKSDKVADIRYLIRYEALFIEALLAIVYCIVQS